jgi:hypothetical protein
MRKLQNLLYYLFSIHLENWDTPMPPILFLPKESYIASIKNSENSNAFRNSYALVNGKKTDIMRNGELSCAFFVSTMLHNYNLLKFVHANVDSTILEMERASWQTKSRPAIGDVLLWEAIRFPDGKMHRHLGFYLGKNIAISNHPARKVPHTHHWTFGKKGSNSYRAVERIFSPPF